VSAGERIREARKAKGLTQKQLAEKMQISYVNISQLERGDRSPSIDTLNRIAAALEITTAHLIGYAVEDTQRNPIWDIDLNSKLKQVGCSASFSEDTERGEQYVWINYPDGGTLEVTEQQLKELHNNTNEYLRFKLDELKKINTQNSRAKGGDPDAT